MLNKSQNIFQLIGNFQQFINKPWDVNTCHFATCWFHEVWGVLWKLLTQSKEFSRTETKAFSRTDKKENQNTKETCGIQHPRWGNSLVSVVTRVSPQTSHYFPRFFRRYFFFEQLFSSFFRTTFSLLVRTLWVFLLVFNSNVANEIRHGILSVTVWITWCSRLA